MSMSQGNGPLTAGMAVGLFPKEELTDDQKMQTLYEEADPDHASADADSEPDPADPDDMVNNDAL